MTENNPTELARVALRRLAELKLPPTPENFTRYYDAAANRGAAPRGPGAVAKQLDESTVLRFDELVGRAVATTTLLTTGLDRHDRQLETSLDDLVDATTGPAAMELLRSVLAMSHEMHATIKASQAELLETRASLAEIKSQLGESQMLLRQDPLTKTENRRAMSAILGAEIARARRDGEPLSVVMVDLDHFKAINDVHGHVTGDAALVHVTALARSMLRGNDAFIRYGGEEFLIVLPETALQGGVSTGRRLQSLLKRQPLVQGTTLIPMTFSGGVSELGADDTEDTLIRRADVALYEAKRKGRDLVVASNPEPGRE